MGGEADGQNLPAAHLQPNDSLPRAHDAPPVCTYQGAQLGGERLEADHDTATTAADALQPRHGADAAKHIVKFAQKQLKADASEHLHVLWYCINAQSNRFLDVEADFIKALSRLPPSIVVMTQCLGHEDQDAQEFAHVVRGLLDGHDADVSESSPLRTLALPRRVGSVTYEPFGLTDVVATTYEMLPEAVKRGS